ncbi:MAG: hypothetical protein HY606_05580 [Planctomycetes bacterium]|nr:hypothetical protein [Planctomycetota bacterium]
MKHFIPVIFDKNGSMTRVKFNGSNDMVGISRASHLAVAEPITSYKSADNILATPL